MRGLRLSIEEAFSSAVQRFGLGVIALKEAVNGSRHRFSYLLVEHLQTSSPSLRYRSLHAFVDSLPPTTRIYSILYGRTVSVYDFSSYRSLRKAALILYKIPTEVPPLCLIQSGIS